MRRPIFTEDASGNLIAMRPAAPPTEDVFQELIAKFPEIVSETDGELLLVRREIGVPDAEEASDRWSLDHLFVSKNAVPVLIEVKRASDTRIRREVVGQLLDYAANGVAYWPNGTLKAAFRATCEQDGVDEAGRIGAFLDGENVDEFWDQVDANLSAGRLRMVVAADVIPSELARIIEFMNEQMRAEVRAVELRYFESEDGKRTLVPRIIGETEKAKSAKSNSSRADLPPITRDEWLDLFVAPKGRDVLSGVQRHVALIEELGGEIDVATTQGSIYSCFQGEDGKKVWPLFVLKNGTISVSFAWVSGRKELKEPEERQKIYDRFVEIFGSLSTTNIAGHPAFPAAKLNDDETFAAYEKLATKYIRRVQAA
jgi:hypothetical protein